MSTYFRLQKHTFEKVSDLRESKLTRPSLARPAIRSSVLMQG